MSSLAPFALLRPDSVAAAARLRREHPGSRFLAGGTDLLPNLRRGLVRASTLIDLSGIAELSELRVGEDALRIGAGVSLAAIAAHPVAREKLPALAQAALSVAGPTHRMAATLGGNLCLDTRCRFYNQSEYWRASNNYCMKLDGDVCRVAPKSDRCYAAFSGDLAPALMVLDAQVEVVAAEGRRRVAIADLYRDDGMAWLGLDEGEVVASVTVPLRAGVRSAYEKIRVRGSIDFPLAGVAAALEASGNTITRLRLACTGVSSRPEPIEHIEGVDGVPMGEAALAAIEKHVKKGIQPMGTTLSDVAYRRRVTPILARRVVQRLWEART